VGTTLRVWALRNLLLALRLGSSRIRDILRLWGYFWFVPLLPALYAVILFFLGGLRPEHIIVSIVAAVVGYGTAITGSLFLLALPGLLVAWGDDAIRYLRPIFVTQQRILGCSVRNVELTLFGVGPDRTLSDYFASHHAPLFDLLAAIPYGIFWLVLISYVCWLWYVDTARLSYFLWSLLVAQITAWIVWLALPVAPPWYIHQYGCTMHAETPPSAAALLRVDHLLGIHYFQDFYGRGATTFGAMPSMHCVFPMIGLLTAWRAINWTTRPLHLIYVISMIAASVYLQHHWLIDGLVGWIVSAFSVLVINRTFHLLGRDTTKPRSRPARSGLVDEQVRDALPQNSAGNGQLRW
jgi:inositol phosphorylceramide synthase catalytic subunit